MPVIKHVEMESVEYVEKLVEARPHTLDSIFDSRPYRSLYQLAGIGL